MITVRKFQGKWRIEIVNEVFEFKDFKTFKRYLDGIVVLKDRFADLQEFKERGK